MQWKKFASQDIAQTLIELGSAESGLSPTVAEERLIAVGKNNFESHTWVLWGILKRRAKSSFLYLLLAAATLSYFLSDSLEAVLILLFVVINAGLETYQEYHSEKAVRLLKRYLVVHVRVRRDGKVVAVESENIVPGDIVVVEAGDRLPADVRFIETRGLMVDETLMTGESSAIPKSASTLKIPPVEMYDADNVGFAGTVVTAGRGEAVVFATGKETALGDIATLTTENGHKTDFEKGVAEFSRFIVKLVLATIAFVFLANALIKGDGVHTGELLVFSLVLAVSVVPEALPAIITVALSRGALRLAQKKVVVKRLSAIEDLGSVEILCTDKTGTLTENTLSVSHIKAKNEQQCLRLALAAALTVPDHRGKLHDAFDLALWQKLSSTERTAIQAFKRLDTLPFDPERRRNSVLLEIASGAREVVVRGAPEEILRRSRNVDGYTAKELLQWVKKVGEAGERVLAVARRPFSEKERFTLYMEQHLEFVGLISFVDQLKLTAKHTLERAKRLNVGVKILTGDSKEVAGAVGCAVGLLAQPSEVMTGMMLFDMPYEERLRAVVSKNVFARVSPREKYEIIKMLQKEHVVGFLGEGINDAPALKLADVGIVVQGAADIAREASDIVLLQKSLATIVDGIKEGRTIFANILKYLKVTLTSNFGNFYSVALASLFLPFVPLLPIQILLLNLLSDFPMIAIATDTVDAAEMTRPKSYQVHAVVLVAILFGGVSSFFDFVLFGMFAKVSPEALQTAWFILSVVTEVILIFSLRTQLIFFRAKRPAPLLFGLACMALIVAISMPFTVLGTDIFGFIKPNLSFMFIVLGLSAGYFIATEIVKHFYSSHFRGGHTLHVHRKKTAAARV